MLNTIWAYMLLLSVVFSFITGKTDAVASAAISGASEGASLIFSMVGVMCFWSGLMSIAEKSGIIRYVSCILRPITRILFPKLPKNSEAMQAIVMNMSANLLGMGNAATPLGLRAMKLLDAENKHRRRASDEMCMFTLVNTASLQLIPTTLLLFRQNHGSQNPGCIIVPIWIVSVCALIVGTVSAKFFEKRS